MVDTRSMTTRSARGPRDHQGRRQRDYPARRLAALGGRRIGPHLPLAGGLLKAAERARAVGATAIQVFADNPTGWRRRPVPPVHIEAFRERLTELDIRPLAIHASYLINLCSADDDLWERSIEGLAAELRMGIHYGATMVNVHIGSHRGMGPDVGIARLAEAVTRVLSVAGDDPRLPVIVLENSAGAGDGLGSRIEELAAIAAAMDAAGVQPARVGFCLDSAHLWGAGYALDRPDELDLVLRRMNDEVGQGRLRMIHLNDSKVPLGSFRDRHEHIAAGGIGPVGMHALLTHPALADVPAYLETPAMELGLDKVDMSRVRALVAGRDLPRLPLRATRRPGATGHRAGRRSPAGATASDTPELTEGTGTAP